MSEFTHDNFQGCTDDELSALNTALAALNAAENYDDVPEQDHDERAFENGVQNAVDIINAIINALGDEITVEALLNGVLALRQKRGGSGQHVQRAQFRAGGTIFTVLRRYQANDGRWWVVLEHPDSRVRAEYPTSKIKWVE